ncbi:MAG: OmpA family protein [Planctomycetota bacterium]|nr:OmpA family protein [Planctomycetota bacterium]MDA1163473.1 OmpA family protein [Planctomycetota bacterium]
MEFEEDAPPGVPEWVVTYGDMMSLLLTFFIMLVSMSELKDEGKNRAALNSMKEVFGPMDGTSGAPGRTFNSQSDSQHLNANSARNNFGLNAGSVDSNGSGGQEKAGKSVNHGEIVTVGGSLEFDQFETNLTAEATTELDRLIDAIKRLPNRIIVRGHSFAEPVRRKPQFRDQHDLSFARAQSVAKYLIEKNIDPQRIQVSAAGDAEPRELTRNLDDRRRNRRVDVFTVDRYVSPSDPG